MSDEIKTEVVPEVVTEVTPETSGTVNTPEVVIPIIEPVETTEPVVKDEAK